MPPGAASFCTANFDAVGLLHYFYCDAFTLELHRYPRLQRLVLQGPIVQSGGEDEPPFMLPADARVGCAPAVGRVQPVSA